LISPRNSLQKIPKVQLHCHLEGTVRAETFLALAQRCGLPLTTRSAENIYQFVNFQEFLLTFQAVCRSLQQPDDYARVLYEYAEDARAHNVMYAELFISPSVWRFFHAHIDIGGVCARLWRAAQSIARTGGPEIRFIFDLTRNFGPESALKHARLAFEFQRYGIIGIGLGGDEAKFPPERFADEFAAARRTLAGSPILRVHVPRRGCREFLGEINADPIRIGLRRQAAGLRTQRRDRDRDRILDVDQPGLRIQEPTEQTS